jgi:hypothetical protein
MLDIYNAILALGGTFGTAIFIVITIFFLRQRKAQEFDIPPLDLIDAKKLDELVSSQVEIALKPMLKSSGYTEEQINEVLTRTSFRSPIIRR